MALLGEPVLCRAQMSWCRAPLNVWFRSVEQTLKRKGAGTRCVVMASSLPPARVRVPSQGLWLTRQGGALSSVPPVSQRLSY